LLLACGSGSAFNNVQLVLRRSTGVSSSSSNNSANIFLKWTFNMFVVEKIEFSYADPSPEETITAKFGALEISYWQQSPDGQLLAKPAQQWSQVSASNDMFVGS
jgi:type VI secretion system secreted protein Hcp